MLETWRVHADSQALLFTGPEGIGKRSLAKQVAQSLLCRQADPQTGEPCGVCSACTLFLAGTHPDFHHLAIEGKERNIPIDRIRSRLIADIGLRPQQGRRKVYLLEADDLAETAQNALLKTLEEPYEYAYILLTVSQVAKLLPTTISRMQEIRLTAYDDAEMEAIMHLHDVRDPHLLRTVLAVSGGIPGTALTLAGGDWFPELRAEIFRMMSQLLARPRAEILTADVKYLLDQREHAEMYLDLMEAWLRDLVVYDLSGDTSRLLHQDQIPHYQGLDSRLRHKFGSTGDRAIMTSGSEAVYRALAAVGDARRALAQNVNAEMALTRLMMELMKQLR